MQYGGPHWVLRGRGRLALDRVSIGLARDPIQVESRRIIMAIPLLLRGLRLTVFGRSCALIASELAVNALCWILAGILFGRHDETRDVLNLCLLAWVCAFTAPLDRSLLNVIDPDVGAPTWYVRVPGSQPLLQGLRVK